MTEWVWVQEKTILAIHQMQLLEHGGQNGIRDKSLLESALNRPWNTALYGEADAASIAASYVFGISRDHPFADGNKRPAFVAAELFLNLNGYALRADDAECVVAMMDLAARKLNEQELAAWFRQYLEEV